MGRTQKHFGTAESASLLGLPLRPPSYFLQDSLIFRHIDPILQRRNDLGRLVPFGLAREDSSDSATFDDPFVGLDRCDDTRNAPRFVIRAENVNAGADPATEEAGVNTPEAAQVDQPKRMSVRDRDNLKRLGSNETVRSQKHFVYMKIAKNLPDRKRE